MRFLMCRPDFYGIEYEINPWMDINKKANQALAITQWENLVATMKKCGAEIDFIAPEKGWPDMVFTANGGLYYKEAIILPHFKHKERQGELPYLEAWFKKHGFKITNHVTDNSPYFEGAGDALLAGNQLFVGFGFRSDTAFYDSASFFDQDHLVCCELTDPYFYHIDTCFCPLNADTAIWFPNAFSKESQEKMAKHIKLLPVVADEAKHFSCNAVVINQHVIIPTGCPQLTKTLEDHGFTVHACDMSEFIKAGGACKCLTLRID